MYIYIYIPHFPLLFHGHPHTSSSPSGAARPAAPRRCASPAWIWRFTELIRAVKIMLGRFPYPVSPMKAHNRPISRFLWIFDVERCLLLFAPVSKSALMFGECLDCTLVRAFFLTSISEVWKCQRTKPAQTLLASEKKCPKIIQNLHN